MCQTINMAFNISLTYSVLYEYNILKIKSWILLIYYDNMFVITLVTRISYIINLYNF